MKARPAIRLMTRHDAELVGQQPAADAGMNVTESAFLMALAQRWPAAQAFRHGWPDFLVLRDADVIGVEIKSGADPLRPAQVRMMTALERVGIHCYVWHPSKPRVLRPWRKYRHQKHKEQQAATEVIRERHNERLSRSERLGICDLSSASGLRWASVANERDEAREALARLLRWAVLGMRLADENNADCKEDIERARSVLRRRPTPVGL